MGGGGANSSEGKGQVYHCKHFGGHLGAGGWGDRWEKDTCNIVNTVAAILGWRENDIVNNLTAILGWRQKGTCNIVNTYRVTIIYTKQFGRHLNMMKGKIKVVEKDME